MGLEMRQARMAMMAAVTGLGLIASGTHPAAAQSVGPTAQGTVSAARTHSSDRIRLRPRRVPTRIEIYPSQRLYRQCVDWYAIERRPSGDVITPQMRCRWALR
jgi:hypothetical protein